MKLKALFIAAGLTASLAATTLAPQVVGATGRRGGNARFGGLTPLLPQVWGTRGPRSSIWDSAQDVAGTVTVLETSTTTLTLVSTTPTSGWTEKTVHAGPPRVAVTFTNATDTVYTIARVGLYVQHNGALGIRLNDYSCTPI